jgi:hypothetical protein
VTRKGDEIPGIGDASRAKALPFTRHQGGEMDWTRHLSSNFTGTGKSTRPADLSDDE